MRQCGASITPTSATLEAANGASMKVLGKTTLYVKVDRVSVKKVDVLVSDDIGSDDLLLSWQNLITLRVLSADFPSPMPEVETARCNKVNGSTQIKPGERGRGREDGILARGVRGRILGPPVAW